MGDNLGTNEHPNTTSDTSRFESVAQIVDRLGVPPQDVVRTWFDDAQAMGLEIGSKADEFDATEPIWRSLWVGSDGHLIRLDAQTRDVTELPDSSDMQVDLDSEYDDRSKSQEPSAPSSQTALWRKLAMPAIAVGSLGVLGAVLYPHSGKTSSTSTDADPVKSLAAVDAFAPSTISQFQSDSSPASKQTSPVARDHDGPLELAMEDTDTGVTSDGRNTSFSLDDFLPPELTLPSMDLSDASVDGEDKSIAKSKSPEVEINADASGNETPAEGDTGKDMPSESVATSTGPAADLLADENEGDESMDNAVEQPTKESESQAPGRSFVSLPVIPVKDSKEPSIAQTIPPWKAAPKQLQLDFPFDVPLKLQRLDSKQPWEIIDSSKQITVARLGSSTSDEAPQEDFQFRWFATAASARSACSFLPHGRLRDDQGHKTFLRTAIEADVVTMDAQKQDVKLKWDLGAPIPPRVTRLDLELSVPKKIDLGWIEQIDPSSPRRTRGIAVLSLRDAEDVAMAVRVDVRTSKILSLRARYSARLASSMPWQWTDRKSVQQTLSQVSERLEVAQNQLIQLDAGISQASRMRARRQELLLERQREQVDSWIDQMTVIAKRLAELDELMAHCASVTLKVAISVAWEDDEQSLFVMRSADELEH